MQIEDIPNNVFTQARAMLLDIATRQPSIAHTTQKPRFFGPNENEISTGINKLPFFGDGNKDNACLIMEPPTMGLFNPQSQNFGGTINLEFSVMFKVKNDDYAKQYQAQNKALEIGFKILTYFKENRENWLFIREFKEENVTMLPGAAGPKGEQLYGCTISFPVKVLINLLYNPTDWL